jgi:hypothetical protein
MAAKCLLVFFLGLSLIPSRVQAQSSPGKQSRVAHFYAQQPSGELLQVPLESSMWDTEDSVVVRSASRSSSVVRLRIPGARSAIRFKEGDPIELWAELPKNLDPRMIELYRFDTLGQQRVTYPRRFQAPSGEGHWNTLSFRARQSRDGKWLFEPATQPQPGEYCFTPPTGNDFFCFGVDKK